MGGPLHIACYKLEPWLVKDLLKNQANVNLLDLEGNTPLHLVLSIWQKNPRKATLISDMLIAGGSQVNRMNYDKWAAIHLASRRGQTGAIKRIVNKNKLLESVGHEKFDISISGGV